MEKVILKKENGIVTEVTISNQLDESPYLANREECFGISASSVKDSKKEDIGKVYEIIEDMLNTVDKKTVSDLMEMIKSSKSISDLGKGVKYLINNYTETINSKFDGTKKSDENKKNMFNNLIKKLKLYLNNNEQLVISIFIKKTISSYYYNLLTSLDKETINRYHNYRLENDSMSNLFRKIGEKFDDNARENGVYSLAKRTFSDQIDIVFENMQKHLCWQSCKNAYALKCPKIGDYIKEEIRKYDFITDGYQIFTKSGNVDTFVVSGCLNYEKEEKRELTNEEKNRARRARESLRMAYFDAETLDEAYIIQSDLEQRGAIHSIRGKRLCLERINQMKKSR